MNFVIMGKPGSGKGSISKILSKKFNMRHINVGDILRSMSENDDEIFELLARGFLAPDNVVCECVLNNLQDGFILDGFPRNVLQFDAFMSAINSHKEWSVIHFLFLDADDDVVVSRMLSRKRNDDTEQIIKSRISIYNQDTKPVLDRMRECGVPIKVVNGNLTIEDTLTKILEVLDLELFNEFEYAN